MVAAPHRQAAEAGVAILRRSGNALDAAIAAAATIAVVYPHMNGIGGDNVWLIYDGARARMRGLIACGRSAARATLGWYRARGIDTALPVRGPLAALTVPGVVDGWWEAHQYSRRALGSPIAWPELLADAIAQARDGFAPSAGQRRWTPRETDLFGANADRALRAGLWPRYHPDRIASDRLVQPELGRTLEVIAQGGAEVFYREELGRRMAAALDAAGSPLSADDFRDHRSEWVEPLTVAYRGGQAAGLPPPTQGFAALAILGLLDGFDLATLEDADYVHLVVEATKLAFEDRDRYLTDPAVVPVPVEHCLDPGRLARRRARIDPRKAMPPVGDSSRGRFTAPNPRVDSDTIAIVTADAQGNAVSMIQSLYHTFGAGVVAGDTGVVMQNRGAFFSLDPAHPNALAPRKRTAHTLIAAMYLVDGRPRFVYGTMGGEGQPQTQAALVTRLVDRGMQPAAAVDAPRWLYGRTWGEPSKALRIEARFGESVARELASRGHDVIVTDPYSDLMGHAHAIAIGDGELEGGSDPRADGAALGA